MEEIGAKRERRRERGKREGEERGAKREGEEREGRERGRGAEDHSIVTMKHCVKK